jgi:NAD(P)H dehydrogenase (quinone)
MDPILVTGAGGQVGGVGHKVVEALLHQGVPVRAMLRVHDHRAARLEGLGAEVVIGDLTQLADVHRALQGCRRIYFGMSVSAHYLEATVNVAAVARSYGLEALVNMSQMTVSQMSLTSTTPSPQHRLHWLSEQVLNWSGLPVIHVRPTVFLENPFFLTWAGESVSAADEIRLPFGAGRTSPIATADVARVITRLLLAPQEHIGAVYELTGPASVDMGTIASEYASALGRPVRYVDVDYEEWKTHQLAAKHLPPHVAAHLATMALLHRENRYDRLTHDVQGVTGTGPMAIREWVQHHRRHFERAP